METNYTSRQTLHYHWNHFLKSRIDIMNFRKIYSFSYFLTTRHCWVQRANQRELCQHKIYEDCGRLTICMDRLLSFSSIQSHILEWIGHGYDIVFAWSWCSTAGTSIHCWASWIHLWPWLSGSWFPCLFLHHV